MSPIQLKLCRRHVGVAIEDFACAFGISGAEIIRFENGDVNAISENTVNEIEEWFAGEGIHFVPSTADIDKAWELAITLIEAARYDEYDEDDPQGD